MTPASCLTVGAMLAEGVPVYAWCSRCRASSNVRLEELAELKGRDYSLVRKRAHCPVCRELVAFHALPNRGGWRVNLSELEG